MFFAQGFYVYRRTTPSGDYELLTLQPLGDNVRTFTDYQVSSGLSYYYVVTFYRDEADPQNPLATIRYESPYSNDPGPISTCPRPPSQPTDIVFIIDNTVSASGQGGGKLQILKDGVVAALDEIVAASTVNSVPDYRMALVTPDYDQVHVRLNFSPVNRVSLENTVAALSPLEDPGGNNFPESTDECILTAVLARDAAEAINTLDCTRPPGDPSTLQIGDFTEAFSKARKLIVLITDAAPGAFCDPVLFAQNPYGEHARDIAGAAHDLCININAIQVPNKDNLLDGDAWSILQDYRAITCGWYSQIPISLLDVTSIKEAILRMFYIPGACQCP
jgi:hypothetical protein